MLEILVYSLVSSLVPAVAISSWMCWQQDINTQDEEEEEILTQFQVTENGFVEQQVNGSNQQQSLDPRLVGWEFKIVRANRNLFRQSEILQQLCQEEAESGWILLEKLDDRRVRFKRPMALREIINSEFLNYDPYRCHYGYSGQPLTRLAAIATLFIALVLPGYLGYTLVSQSLAKSPPITKIPANFPPLEPPNR